MYQVDEKRYFVKIRAGKTQSVAETIYFQNGLTFELMSKYRWYFKYRTALYQVQHPRHFVEMEHGGYKYTPPDQEQLKSLKDKIAGKRRTISKFRTQVLMAEQNWSWLFPIDEDKDYLRALAKIEEHQAELEELENKFQTILQNQI